MAIQRYDTPLSGSEVDQALIEMLEHNSEAYAIGERAGVPVSPSDPAYHNNAKYYALAAIAASANAPYINSDNNHWMAWDTVHMEYVDTGVLASGNGINDIQKTSTVDNVDTYTIYYTDGTTQTFTVTNGLNGSPATVTEIVYAVGTSGTTPPTTGWQAQIPTVEGGQFLWQRTTWNNGQIGYINAQYGVNGSGSGDMTKSVYDSDEEVADAGGIKAFVNVKLADKQAISLSGSGEPTDDGEEGQFYTDTDTNTLYQFIGTEWVSVGGGGSSTRYYSLQTTTTWVQGTFDYTQEITVADMLSTDHAKVDVDLSTATSSADVEAMLSAWQNMYRFETANGKIIVHSSQEATTVVHLIVEVD